MTSQGITAQIVDELNDLALEQRQQVLDFARSLATQPKGIKGSSLLNLAGTISSNQLLQMQNDIVKRNGSAKSVVTNLERDSNSTYEHRFPILV